MIRTETPHGWRRNGVALFHSIMLCEGLVALVRPAAEVTQEFGMPS